MCGSLTPPSHELCTLQTCFPCRVTVLFYSPPFPPTVISSGDLFCPIFVYLPRDFVCIISAVGVFTIRYDGGWILCWFFSVTFWLGNVVTESLALAVDTPDWVQEANLFGLAIYDGSCFHRAWTSVRIFSNHGQSTTKLSRYLTPRSRFISKSLICVVWHCINYVFDWLGPTVQSAPPLFCASRVGWQSG